MSQISCLLLLIFTFPTLSFARDYVLIGDSHSCGAFGLNMLKEFKARGDKLTLYCSPSTSPAHWIGSPPAPQPRDKSGRLHKFQKGSTETMQISEFNQGRIMKAESIIRANSSATVIVALGTNTLPGSANLDASFMALAKAAKKNGNCVWIGAPYFNDKQKKGYNTIAMNANLHGQYKNLGQDENGKPISGNNVNSVCPIKNSRPITKNLPGRDTVDGVHRTEAGGKAWAHAIAGVINITQPPVAKKPAAKVINNGTASVTVQVPPPVTPPAPASASPGLAPPGVGWQSEPSSR